MHAIYFSQLWPKLSFSAAHVRTLGIVERLLVNGYNIHFISPQQLLKGEELGEYHGVKLHQGDPGNTSQMAQVLAHIKGPKLAIFDTYISEERYSHYIYQMYPNCLRVLDLQDFHSLRMTREKLLNEQCQNSLQSVKVLKAQPQLGDQIFDREAASIIVKYVTLCFQRGVIWQQHVPILKRRFQKTRQEQRIILNLLQQQNQFKIYKQKEKIEQEKIQMLRDYSRKKHFVFLGNMSHAPNYDGVRYLVEKIWPAINKELPNTELHIYGTNLPKEIKSNQALNVRQMGQMKSLSQLAKYKVNLAPLRFGAGIKGKITDGWSWYLPVVTTPIGAEGLFLQSLQSIDYATFTQLKQARFFSDIKTDELTQEQYELGRSQQEQAEKYYQYDAFDTTKLDFGGFYNNFTDDQFIRSAIQLYTDQTIWEEKMNMGLEILQKRMEKFYNQTQIIRELNDKILFKGIYNQFNQYLDKRKLNIMQKLAWSETLRSNFHFAKFLNEKRQHENTRQNLQKRDK